MKKRRFLRGRSLPEYAALEPHGEGLMVASNKPFVFTDSDGRPLEQPEAELMEEVKPGGKLWLNRFSVIMLLTSIRSKKKNAFGKFCNSKYSHCPLTMN